MYLTQFEINTARRGAQKLLGSPQAMHAAVLAGFPGSVPLAQGRILWRVDAGPHRTLLYIASPDEPDLTHLVEQAGWPTTATWSTGDLGRLLGSLQPGQEWGFRLTANPTRSTRVNGHARSQRVGCVTAEQQLDWFLDRAGGWGFSISAREGAPAVAVTSRHVRAFRRAGATVTVAVATYDGQLTVADPSLMCDSLAAGLGAAKAYGCGLLTLAPALPSP